MRVALRVFDALKTFARPATRAEIEREAGLDIDQVTEALRTLDRAGVLIRIVPCRRQRGLYQLKPGALRPETRRGRYNRAARPPQSQRANWVRDYHAASPPSHAAAPGGARVIVRGVLPLQAPSTSFGECLLARVWVKR